MKWMLEMSKLKSCLFFNFSETRRFFLNGSLLLLFYSFVFNQISFSQTCTVGGDQVSYGAGSWTGYVYDHNGVGNPVTSPFATYKGFVTETDNFNRNWGTGNPSCAAGANNFAVRYRMRKTFTGGTYTLTIGADDGVRLSIDGGATWILSRWFDSGYGTVSANVPLGGTYDMVIEYYEKSGDARVSYSSSLLSSEIRLTASVNRVTVCGGTFYDSGGSSGSYVNNELNTITFYPSNPGEKVRLDFSAFVTETSGSCADWDILRIYDGNSSAAPLVRESQTGCSSRPAPGVVTSTACDGSLTVVFKSDNSLVETGWVAAISCVPLSLAATFTSTNVTNCTSPNGSISVVPSNTDFAGGTSWYSNNFSSVTPQVGTSTLSGNAVLDAGNLRLTNNVNSQFGQLIVANPGFNAGHVEANFNLFIGAGTGADGMTINYGNLQIWFDTYRNGTEVCLPQNTSGGNTAISVSYNGTQVSCYGTLAIRNSWQQVYLRVNAANQLYLKVGSTVIFNNIALGAGYAAADKSTWAWNFSAFTGGANDQHRIDDLRIVAYQQYEYSLDNSTWQNGTTFSNLMNGTYTVYMRARAPQTRCPLYTITLGPIAINAVSPTTAGNPSVFGTNSWNVYGYNGNSTTIAANTYVGFYTQPALGAGNEGIATQNFWGNGNSPSNAGTTLDNGNLWNGCSVNADNHTFVHKRRGFPCGTYTFTMNDWDDETRIIINGVNVWSCGVWSGNTGGYSNSTGSTYSCVSGPTFTFQLDANSEVEIQVFEGAGLSNLGVDIIKVVPPSLAGNVTRMCPTSGSTFIDFTDATGRLIASVNPNSNNLGNVTITSYVGTPAVMNACAQPSNPLFSTVYMGRTWVMTSSAYPSGANFPSNVTVRLPFNNSELTSLNTTADASTTGNPNDGGTTTPATLANLMLTKITGATENGVANAADCASTILGITTSPASGTNYLSITNTSYKDFNVGQFSEFFLHKNNAGMPLPVELISFSGTCTEKGTELTWQTASESNNDYFIVQRSRDGQNWEDLTAVNGNGNSTQLINYDWLDEAGFDDMYYRLTQVDFNGDRYEKQAIFVNCESESTKLNVYPNPTQSDFTVEVNSTKEVVSSTISIIDVTGKALTHRNVEIHSGVNTFNFGDQLESGTYLIRVNMDDDIQTLRLVVKN